MKSTGKMQQRGKELSIDYLIISTEHQEDKIIAKID
jgi:hypothetical protein